MSGQLPVQAEYSKFPTLPIQNIVSFSLKIDPSVNKLYYVTNTDQNLIFLSSIYLFLNAKLAFNPEIFSNNN